uniref:Uncharacterized protein n=1 Tax=Ananas comosus var. bracteatus TaxID=296719 RepID=A0A6V7Q8E3_ANACO|nr:unnamed protein product [Ananas comosus var. bracteatus]
MSPDFTSGERCVTRQYRRKQRLPLKIEGAEVGEDPSDTVSEIIAKVLMGPIWQDDTKGSDSPSVSGQVLLDYLFGGPTRNEVINVYFHIIDKLDCIGEHKFSQPGIFCRSEVAMHVLNRMQGIGKDKALTADFVRDVAFGSASIRHFLEEINAHTCSNNRFVLIPLHSN